MTFTITKLHLAIAVIAIAVLAPATTALATHVFNDVPDDRFYSDAVAWAAANGITTGTSATTFEPEANVTRGQNVTFAKRYDDNIVQPALTELGNDIAINATGIAAAIGGLVTNTAIYEIDATSQPASGDDPANEFFGECTAEAPIPMKGSIYFIDEGVPWIFGSTPAWAGVGVAGSPFGYTLNRQLPSFSITGPGVGEFGAEQLPADFSKSVALITICAAADFGDATTVTP